MMKSKGTLTSHRSFKDLLKGSLETTAGRRSFEEKSDLFLSSHITTCQVKKCTDVDSHREHKTKYLVFLENQAGHKWMVSWTYNDFSELHYDLKDDAMINSFEFPGKISSKESRKDAFNEYVQLLVSYETAMTKDGPPKDTLPKEVAMFFLPGELFSADVVGYEDRHPEDEESGSCSFCTIFGGGVKTFYTVELANDDGVTWQIERTSSDFLQFFKAMKRKVEETKKFKFPTKSYFASGKEEDKAECKEKLDELCKIYVNHKPQEPEIWSFFLPSSIPELRKFMSV